MGSRARARAAVQQVTTVVSRDDEQAHRGVKLEDASSMRTISTPLPSAARSKFAAAQEVACEPHSARPSRLHPRGPPRTRKDRASSSARHVTSLESRGT